MHFDLASDEALSLQHWHGADAWPDSSMSPVSALGAPGMPSDSYDSSPTGVSPVGEQAALLYSAIDPTLPLLEDELLADLDGLSLHALFYDPDGDLPPVLFAPQPAPASTTATSSLTPSATETSTVTDSSDASDPIGANGASPVGEATSSTQPTNILFASASSSIETAADPVIASMTLTRETDWDRQGGTATVSVEVYNGTGSAVAVGDYWVTFFVDRGVEGITVPEPTHAVPALAPGETTDVPSVATDIVVAAGAEPGLYHLRAALVTNPNAPPREVAPLLVKAAGDLSVEWSRVDVIDLGGTIQTMGGGGGGMGGGGVPHVDEVYLTPSSIWTESGGTSQASANVCNNSGEPMGQQPQYTVTFSENGDDISIPAGQETHDVPQLDDGACALVPLWDGVDVVVAPRAAAATYQVTATLSEGAGSKSAPLYVVEVTDWKVEWENPPGSDTWVVPTDQTADGTPYVWSHDTTRWTALGINPKDPPAVTRIDWEASSGGGDPVPFASVTCDCPAVGSPGPGKWDVNSIVYFEGGTIAWGPSKQIVVARINNVEWNPATGPEAGVLDETGGEIVFFPDAAELGGGYRFLVRVEADVTPSGVAGIKVQFKAYDVDDPSDYNGPIDDDRDDDNVGGPDNLV